MKTQCDSCNEKAASVFCYVEEMALCSSCERAHNENLLTRDHQLVSFFYPAKINIPICDVCQETKAFVFCREHRALLCRRCNVTMHAKDKFGMHHNMFVLSGAQLCTENNQLVNESGSSINSNINTDQSTDIPLDARNQNLHDMSLDDPYGLCKKGEEDASTFQDTDLGSFLSSLSPKNNKEDQTQ